MSNGPNKTVAAFRKKVGFAPREGHPSMSTETQRVEGGVITFRKSAKPGLFYVELDGKPIGSVLKVEDWTIRGTRVRWEARTTHLIGWDRTRKEAAERLADRARLESRHE